MGFEMNGVTGKPPGELLEVVAALPQKAAVMVDFDGTLSAIVEDPSAAIPQEGAIRTLMRLAACFSKVAVVSGRPVGFLLSHFDLRAFPPTFSLIGLYGLERAIWPAGDSPSQASLEVSGSAGTKAGPVIVVEEGAELWRQRIEDAAQRIGVEVPAGVLLESKGLALTFHWRQADDPLQAQRWVWAEAAELSRLFGLEILNGKKAVELRPPLRVDKGTALLSMGRGLRAVCYLGDDLGDLKAFDALDELTREGEITMKVAVGGREAPPELLARADVVVEGPVGAVKFLEVLADAAESACGDENGCQ